MSGHVRSLGVKAPGRIYVLVSETTGKVGSVWPTKEKANEAKAHRSKAMSFAMNVVTYKREHT